MFLCNRTICCQIFKQVGDWVAFGLEFTGIKWDSAGGLRPQAGRMVDIVRAKARFLHLLGSQVLCELVDDRSDDLKVGKLFCPDIIEDRLPFFIWHGIALAQIPERRSRLPVGTAVLRKLIML